MLYARYGGYKKSHCVLSTPATIHIQLVKLDEIDSKLKWSELATAFGFRVACRVSFRVWETPSKRNTQGSTGHWRE
jgi:hypothetical protein